MSRAPDEEKQQRIIRSAIAVFGTLGFEGATMKDIADQAAVAPGTLYTYFADKQALFVAAVDKLWDDFFAGTRTILQSSRDPVSLSTALLDYGMDTLSQLYPLVRGMIADANRLDLVHQRLDTLALQISKGLQGHRGSDFESLRIWISGVLFLLASVPVEKLQDEIARLKLCLNNTLEKS